MHKLFISHIHEEAPLAKVFKDWLEEKTAGYWNVFVSSDPRSNAAGEKWFSLVNESLENNRILIALCSPAALKSLWIGYEIGYSAAKNVPIIPICHSGLGFSQLPPFVGNNTGLDLNDQKLENNLFDALHKAAPLLQKPQVHEGEIRDKINIAMSQISPTVSETPNQLSNSEGTDLDEECANLLKMLANTEKGHSTRYVLSQHMNTSSMIVQHHAKTLEGKGLLSISSNLQGGNGYDLTYEGVGYAQKKGWIDKKEEEV